MYLAYRQMQCWWAFKLELKLSICIFVYVGPTYYLYVGLSQVRRDRSLVDVAAARGRHMSVALTHCPYVSRQGVGYSMAVY